MAWVHYKMVNTSTRTDTVNHITIQAVDTFTQEVIGTARIVSIDDIYLELPEVKGRYQANAKLRRYLDRNLIDTLEDMLRYSWLLSNGADILHNLKAAR